MEPRNLTLLPLCRAAWLAAVVGLGCAAAIELPVLRSHRFDDGQVALKFTGVRRTGMGLASLHVVAVRVDRVPAGWTLRAVTLDESAHGPCGRGHPAGLIDTWAGRTGDGVPRVQAPGRIEAGFRAEQVADVWDGPSRLDLLFADAHQRPRCTSMVLSE